MSASFPQQNPDMSSSSVCSAGSGGSGGSSSGGGGGGGNKRLRRSCDRCTSKKIKCDGLAACENCARRGYACHYSARKRTGPKIKLAQEEHPEWRGHAYGNGLIPWLQHEQQQQPPPEHAQKPEPPPAPQPPQGAALAPQPTMPAQDMGAAYAYPAMPSLPVPSLPVPPLATAAPSAIAAYMAGPAPQPPSAVLSPSAVPYFGTAPQMQGLGTGAVVASPRPLVGRSEKEFMEAYLAEVNSFLPLVEEAWLRAEVKRFAAGAALPMSTVAAMNEGLYAQTAAARVRDVQLGNAHNARLWAALAVGAMLCGGGPDEVCRYSRLAWVSLRECFDLNEPATVSAYLLVSMVSMMHGQLDRFRRYVAMAESISRELGATLSPEVEATLRYVSVGLAPDVRLLERQWQDTSTMGPSSDDPHMQMLHRLTRAKIYLIYHRHQAELRAQRGLPRTPIDFLSVFTDLGESLATLRQSRAATSSLGNIFISGLLGVMTYVRSRGTAPAEALEIMKPIINHLIRCPGVLRLMPSYHMLHSIAMLLQATKDWATYEAVQRRFSAIQWGDCAVLPPLGTPLDGLCGHPICDAMEKLSAEARRRALSQLPGAVGAGESPSERPNLKRDRSSGGGVEQDAAKMEEDEMTGLNMDDLETLGQLFSGSDFPAYEVF